MILVLLSGTDFSLTGLVYYSNIIEYASNVPTRAVNFLYKSYTL